MRQRWTDPEPGAWIAERIHDFAVDVGSVIPVGFEAYARLFHPAWLSTPEGERPVRWSEVAEANGRVVHAKMQWANISGVETHSHGSAPGLWDQEPPQSLPREYAAGLAELLAPHTTTPERVWFCVWGGYGGLDIDGSGDSASWSTLERGWYGRLGGGLRSWRRRRRKRPPEPTIRLPKREYYLYVGQIESISESFTELFWTPANLWWPDDRAWCVASEIDFAWTYVGGTNDCVQAVLGDDRFEALPASIEHQITYAADTINPHPATDDRG